MGVAVAKIADLVAKCQSFVVRIVTVRVHDEVLADLNQPQRVVDVEPDRAAVVGLRSPIPIAIAEDDMGTMARQSIQNARIKRVAQVNEHIGMTVIG